MLLTDSTNIDAWLWAPRTEVVPQIEEPASPVLPAPAPEPAPEVTPAHPDAAFVQAVALHRLGQTAEAMALYASVPPDGELYTTALSNLIALSAERGDDTQLRTFSQALLTTGGHTRSALEGLMQAEMACCDFKAATQHGVRLVKTVPDSYEAWFNLGLCYQKTNHGEQAAQAYAEAVKLKPDGNPARINLGAVLQQRGDLNGARKEFERVLEQEPGNVAALGNLAIIHEKEGHADKAEKIYLGLIREQQKVFDSAFRLGRQRLERRNYLGAAEAFERCLLERPDDTVTNRNLLQLRATVAIQSDDWKSAAAMEQRLNELGENTAVLAFNIGVLQQNESLHEEAAESYRRACKQQPNFAEAQLNLGEALRQSGHVEEASIAWRAALEAKPELAAGYFGQESALIGA